MCASKPKLRGQRLFPHAPRTTLNGFAPGIQIVAKIGHVRDRSARVRGPIRPTVPPQSTPCRFRFTLGQTRTIFAKRAEVHQNLSRRPSPDGTATRRWPVKCRRGHHGVQTRGAGAADHGIEDERHARHRALSRSVGTADGVPVTGRCRLLLNCAVGRGAELLHDVKPTGAHRHNLHKPAAWSHVRQRKFGTTRTSVQRIHVHPLPKGPSQGALSGRS